MNVREGGGSPTHAVCSEKPRCFWKARLERFPSSVTRYKEACHVAGLERRRPGQCFLATALFSHSSMAPLYSPTNHRPCHWLPRDSPRRDALAAAPRRVTTQTDTKKSNRKSVDDFPLMVLVNFRKKCYNLTTGSPLYMTHQRQP